MLDELPLVTHPWQYYKSVLMFLRGSSALTSYRYIGRQCDGYVLLTWWSHTDYCISCNSQRPCPDLALATPSQHLLHFLLLTVVISVKAPSAVSCYAVTSNRTPSTGLSLKLPPDTCHLQMSAAVRCWALESKSSSAYVSRLIAQSQELGAVVYDKQGELCRLQAFWGVSYIKSIGSLIYSQCVTLENPLKSHWTALPVVMLC